MKNKQAAHFDSEALLASIAAGKTTKEYGDKQTIFSQGDVADAVFYIQKGKVKLTVVSKRGKEAIVAILEPGSFFGEGSLAGQPLRMSTATTLERPTIVRVGKDAMIGVLHEKPAFAEAFIAYLLSRNIRIEEDLVDQLFNSAEKRLADIVAGGALWQGIKARARHLHGQPGNARRDHWHDAVKGQPLYEQVQEHGLH